MEIPVHDVEVGDVLHFIRLSVREKRKSVILYINIHGAVLAMHEWWLKKFYMDAPLVCCDGDGIRWGLKLLGQDLPPKIPLTRWVWQLAEYCEKQKLSLYLLGAADTVVRTAAARLKERHPALKIAGFHHGYFLKRGEANDKMIAEVNAAKPDILLVCFGMPGQEKWVLENKDKLNAWVILPGGGVLNYVAGTLGKVPGWMLRLHLEWLFRLVQEPKRLFKRYATEIPWFFVQVVSWKVKKIFSRG